MPAPMTMMSKSVLIAPHKRRAGPCARTPRRSIIGAMTSVTLYFPLEDYHRRIAKTRKAMEKAGLELILVSDPSNMSWLTGYDGWSFYVHQGVLLGLEGEPVWWGRGMDAFGAKRTVFMHHDNIVGYDDTYVQNPAKHPMEQLAKVIAARGWDGARIGVEMDNYWFSAAAFEPFGVIYPAPGSKMQQASSTGSASSRASMK